MLLMEGAIQAFFCIWSKKIYLPSFLWTSLKGDKQTRCCIQKCSVAIYSNAISQHPCYCKQLHPQHSRGQCAEPNRLVAALYGVTPQLMGTKSWNKRPSTQLQKWERRPPGILDNNSTQEHPSRFQVPGSQPTDLQEGSSALLPGQSLTESMPIDGTEIHILVLDPLPLGNPCWLVPWVCISPCSTSAQVSCVSGWCSGHISLLTLQDVS